MLLALTIGAAWASEPLDPATRARQLATTGAIELTGGIAAAAAGAVVLLVGRGVPGEVSTETQRTADFKSVTGASLAIGGFTTALVGGSTLGKARAYRERAQSLAVSASVGAGGGGLQVSGTF